MLCEPDELVEMRNKVKIELDKGGKSAEENWPQLSINPNAISKNDEIIITSNQDFPDPEVFF